MKRAFSLAAVLLLFGCALPALAQVVPRTLAFQGRLAKPDGTPVADTTSLTLTFRLYDAPTSGNKLWEQTLANSVAVRNGVFAASLNFAANYTNGKTLETTFGSSSFTPYLEIQVGSDAPLAPRQPFTSVAYSFYAATALSIPDGSVTQSKIANGAVGSAQLASGLLGGFWNLTGNAGTDPTTHFLGTTDTQPLVFRTNNKEAMRLLTNGSLGIGANSPQSALHIAPISGITIGQNSVTGGYTALTINLSANTNGNAQLQAVKAAGSTYGDLILNPSSGNVGIGTTVPASTLDVNGAANVAGNLSAASVTVSGDLLTKGWVGIGTNSPNFTLDVNGSISATAGLYAASASIPKLNGGVLIDNYGGANTSLKLEQHGSNFIVRPYDAGSTRTVVENTAGTLYFNSRSSFLGAPRANAALGVYNSGYSYAIDTVGDLLVEGTGYSNNGFYLSSDARYKTHVQTLPGALDTVLALRGVGYDWDRQKWPDKGFAEGRQVGFLAQELETVLPQLVHTDKEGYKSVNYASVAPILVEAVKTLNGKVETQQKQIESQQRRIEQLERQSARLADLEAKLNALLSARK